jgi:hypothetical protein
MLITLATKDMVKLVNETVLKCLNEMYSNNSIFNGDKSLIELEKLVYKFTIKSIDTDSDNEYDIKFSEFVEGLSELYKMSLEKQEFDKINIKELYNNSNGDDFWDNDITSNFYYLDDYINHMELWDNYMPNPEKVKQYIELFAQWLKNHYDYIIESYTKNKWREYEYFIKQINNII